jgi:phospholipid N-methyltransferase
MMRRPNFLAQSAMFFRGFLRHPAMVGSVIPSSRFTIEKMLAPVDWDSCRVFVEYGPGVGTFCRPVLDLLRQDAVLIAIDTNELFTRYLNATIDDRRFVAVEASAEQVEEVLAKHGAGRADYVLSGLPFSTLPAGVGEKIVAATHRALRPGGAFMTYQFSPAARNLTAAAFARVEQDFVWANVPPCKLVWGWKDEAE